jgi:Tol biopolymer transport system component
MSPPHTGAEGPSPGRLLEGQVRTQLERILASQIFVRSERLTRFLRFVVEKKLDGAGDTLKEQVLGHELYGKGLEFDGAVDPIVRVDARRLRDKLREYYAECKRDPVIISLPKGSYVPVFEFNSAAPLPFVLTRADKKDTGVAGEEVPRVSRWRWIAAASLTVLAAVAAWLAFNRPPNPSLRVVPLTSYPGFEGAPSLSPDGNFVAFAWSGFEKADQQKPAPSHIYIKEVGGESLRRLTQAQASETAPSWSPDGRSIAFVRAGQGIFLASVAGGMERKVSDSGTHVGWTPDSKAVLIRDSPGPPGFSIFEISLENLQRRRLTYPPLGIGDWKFDVSPDGEILAFIRYERPGVGDLFRMPMRGGEPRRLTNWHQPLGGVVWTPGGRELIFSVNDETGENLWRISAAVAEPERGVQVAGIRGEAAMPAISRPAPGHPARLAFQKRYQNVSLRLIDLDAPLSEGVIQAVQPFLVSTRRDNPGAFSRDGSRVAFVSDRAGSGMQLWVANRDGANLRKLTSISAMPFWVGSWSPDSRRIAFDAAVNGNSDIYVVDANGGPPVRLTLDRADDIFPNWSSDGRWIYFCSGRTGGLEVWKVPAGGGGAVQVTRNGGFEAQESPDGKFLYYLERPAPRTRGGSRVMRMPVDGGPPTAVLEGIYYGSWSVAEKGIVFLIHEPAFDAVDLYRFSDRKTQRLGRLPFPQSANAGRMTVSRDGRWLLVNKVDRSDADLMLVEDFR